MKKYNKKIFQFMENGVFLGHITYHQVKLFDIPVDPSILTNFYALIGPHETECNHLSNEDLKRIGGENEKAIFHS